MRYTEIRMAKIAHEFNSWFTIKKTRKFRRTMTVREMISLRYLPNQSTQFIGQWFVWYLPVGMATNISPSNLTWSG